MKKTAERQSLDLFRQQLTDFPHARIIAAESPDFILKTRRWSLGIELTSVIADDTFNATARETREWYDSLAGLLGQLIRKKEQKLSHYRKGLHRAYWLVLTYKGNHPISENLLLDAISKSELISSFEKLFLLDENSAKIIELDSVTKFSENGKKAE